MVSLIQLLATMTDAERIADQNTNNASLNNGLDTLNGLITGIKTLMRGTISPFAGSTPPVGSLLCDGSAVSRTTYASLYAVIGTTYGSGDGSTTFNLPNLKGRVPVGYDSSQTEFNSRGKTGGTKTNTLSQANLPNVNLHLGDIADIRTGTGQTFPTTSASLATSLNGTIMEQALIPLGGSGTAFDNTQPYITMNYIIYY